MSQKDNKDNQYLRERIRFAREEAGMSQDELAQRVYKNRVTISDIERGRVNVDAVDLMLIAHALRKPLSFFYAPNRMPSGSLSTLEEELLQLFRNLESLQQYIVLEQVRHLSALTNKAHDRYMADEEQLNIFEDDST